MSEQEIKFGTFGYYKGDELDNFYDNYINNYHVIIAEIDNYYNNITNNINQQPNNNKKFNQQEQPKNNNKAVIKPSKTIKKQEKPKNIQYKQPKNIQYKQEEKPKNNNKNSKKPTSPPPKNIQSKQNSYNETNNNKKLKVPEIPDTYFKIPYDFKKQVIKKIDTYINDVDNGFIINNYLDNQEEKINKINELKSQEKYKNIEKLDEYLLTKYNNYKNLYNNMMETINKKQ